MKQLDNAMSLYEELNSIDPYDVEIYEKLSRIYLLKGKHSEAIQLLLKGIKLYPENPKLHFNLACGYYLENDFKKALEEYIKVTQLSSLILEAYLAISEIYVRFEIFEKAEEYLFLALKYYPNESVIYSNLGIIYAKQNRLKEAVDVFEKALTLNPHDNVANEHIIKINEYLKK